MDFYQLNFAALVAINVGFVCRQYRQGKCKANPASIVSEIEKPAGKEEIARFTHDFFTIYLLVVAADWLQVSIGNSSADGGTNIRMTGSSHLCSVQVRERISRNHCRRTVCGRLHRRSDKCIFRGLAGRQVWKASGMSRILPSIFSLLFDNAFQ
jgi:hypothetical protein